MTIARIRPFLVLPLLAALAACGDDPTGTPTPEPPEPTLKVEGLYEVTLTGLGGPDVQASVAPAGPALSMSPVNTGLVIELLSSGSFTEGARGQGGHRYVNFTYRLRNGTGTPLTNLTLVPASTATTIPGTPFTSIKRYGGAAAPEIATQVVPTTAVTLGAGAEMRALDPDVLQVFEESEVAAIALPAGVTGVFPYGFVVRNARSPATRTLPPANGPDDYAGLVTFAFRVPLAAAGATEDAFSITFYLLAVQDTETRLTESIEEAQDSAAVRRLRERAAALGATTVTVLAGSGAAGPEVPDYPGQRQICSVRTAGTAASPATYITHPAAYTRIQMLRPAETASACGAGFRDGTPQIAVPGSPYALTLRAVDRYGNLRAVADSVRLERVSGPGATFGAPALLAGGEATIQATYGGKGNSLLQATGRRNQGQQQVDVGAPSVLRNTGHRQGGMAGQALAIRPSVLVRDGAGKPLAGRAVVFSVSAGGGTVSGPLVTTDAAGIATVGNWVLGPTAELNTLTATVSGTGVTGNPAQFDASGCEGGGGTGYGITLCFASAVTPSQRAAFQAGATRWQELVTGDLPDAAVNQAPGFCGASAFGLNLTVDDLVIFASIQAIDGPGGVLGSAGPCLTRATGSLPIVGTMRFDAADVDGLESGGWLGSVILHEMGHILGIGTLWAGPGLLHNPSSVGTPLDTWFSGAQGLAGFDAIGGSTYTGGQKVPVENSGSAGRMNTHWRETVLANELMTGTLNAGSNPLSQLSVRSLTDLGYTVDAAGADPFFLTLTLRGGRDDEDAIPLIGDVESSPIYRQDEQGRVTRIR